MRPVSVFSAVMMLALTACQPVAPPQTAAETAPEGEEGIYGDPPPAPYDGPTVVKHQPTLEKILGNSGMSLQWISWEPEDRAPVTASWKGETLHLYGEQTTSDADGRLLLDGTVREVSEGAFVFNGTITISDTPDAGRNCVKEGDSNFGITQGRRYFRMREFEWCDRLTDYIDIYF